MTPVYWRRVKTEAFRAGEGFVSRIRLENIKSCRLANVWIATRIRSNDCGVPGTPRMRRVHSLVEGDRCDTSRRHAPCCATQQPACGMATRRRSKAKAKAEPSGSGSGFAVRSDQRPLTPRTPRTVALRPFQHRSPRWNTDRRGTVVVVEHYPARGQGIEVRGAYNRVARTTHHRGIVLVGLDEQDVWTSIRRIRRCSWQGRIFGWERQCGQQSSLLIRATKHRLKELVERSEPVFNRPWPAPRNSPACAGRHGPGL